MDLHCDIRTRQVYLDRTRHISEYAFDGSLNDPESDDDIDPGEVSQERWTPRHRAIFGLPDPDFQTGPSTTDTQAEQPSENCLIPCSNPANVSMTASASRGVDASADVSPKAQGDESKPCQSRR
ncbi:hypothetical protein CEP54_014497 [Fusarium duplospermum]|uniref:Uncharacterized protein n=1 Tax=Fusarium duplospermum TaxID=1325734 RepID=A0A428NVT9_9HYPO|nr:hypothetical protein CEP54_014497 [Fusarium duplospermum]